MNTDDPYAKANALLQEAQAKLDDLQRSVGRSRLIIRLPWFVLWAILAAAVLLVWAFA